MRKEFKNAKAKHDLNKKNGIRAIGLSFLRDQKRKRERRRRKEKQKVWNFVYICMDTCLWVVGCEKPNPKMNSCMEIITNPFHLSRVLLEFHHNLRFLEIRVGKTPYGTR